jgi:hypothetical protein
VLIQNKNDGFAGRSLALGWTRNAAAHIVFILAGFSASSV